MRKNQCLYFFIFFLCFHFNEVHSIEKNDQSEPPEIMIQRIVNQKLKLFLESETKKARELLSDFSNQELELLWNRYKKGKSLQENRMIWLVDEYHARRADQTAVSRLVYLFLASVLLFLMIIVSLYIIIIQQKKMISRL